MKNIMQPGLKGLSSHNLTAEELALLNIIKSRAGVDGLAKVFDVNADGTVVPLIDAGEDLSAEELMERLDMLVDKGLLWSEFDAKILTCRRCGDRRLTLKTACPSCGSEYVLKSNVYVHGCGALVPEEAVERLISCPKCGSNIGSVKGPENGFVCSSCSGVFKWLRVLVECLGCGWSDMVENAGQVVLRRYGLTEEGLSILVSTDPVKKLVRSLVSEGFTVMLDVRVRGISGAEYVLDIVAVNVAVLESRIYMVFRRVGFIELLDTAVKKLDIDKSLVKGVVGNVRWVAAGPEVEPGAEKIAKTFNVDVEMI
jgi:Zn finger protein HypA/HybF involved in hydrogenase expression